MKKWNNFKIELWEMGWFVRILFFFLIASTLCCLYLAIGISQTLQYEIRISTKCEKMGAKMMLTADSLLACEKMVVPEQDTILQTFPQRPHK